MTQTDREVDALPKGGTRFSRRTLISAGAGAAGVAVFAGGAAAGYVDRAPGPAPAPPKPDGWVLAFRSRPDLLPPRVHMTDLGSPASSEYYFLTPNQGPQQAGSGQQGLMIVDSRGQLVWFKVPRAPSFSNLRVQTYKDEPVLTWWQGDFIPAGFGRGESVIADSSYRTVATIRGANGLHADLHEFLLTPQGTALITAYATTTADLRSIGGSKRHPILNGVAQEIDVATGKLLFEWRSLDHISVEESHNTPTPQNPFDFFHINSIAVDPDDNNLIISARNTWGVYKIDRSSGKILWRLGGKRSDFSMGPGTEFAWQHDARPHGNGVLTLFDDGSSPPVQSQSRGLQLHVDSARRTATLTKVFVHPARLLADSQGNLQLLPDGGAVIGWGSEPYMTEFGADGKMLRDARMPANEESYRTFRAPWVATPPGIPDIAVEADDVDGYTAYVSWNGATAVSTWQLLSGHSPSNLADTGSVPSAGFETAVTLHPKGNYVAVRALDASGQAIATSRTVQLQPKHPSGAA